MADSVELHARGCRLIHSDPRFAEFLSARSALPMFRFINNGKSDVKAHR